MADRFTAEARAWTVTGSLVSVIREAGRPVSVAEAAAALRIDLDRRTAQRLLAQAATRHVHGLRRLRPGTYIAAPSMS